MKKLIALFAFVATLSIVACSNGGNDVDAEQAQKDSLEKVRITDSLATVAREDSIRMAEEAAKMDTMTKDSSTMMEEGHDGSTH